MRRRSLRRTLLALALTFAVAGATGCRSGPVKTEVVALPAYPEPAPDAAAQRLTGSVCVQPLLDRQSEPLDGLIDSLGVPTYKVSFDPAMTEFVRRAIERELLAAGCSLADAAAADVIVDGAVSEHRACTDSTLLYWDVHVDLAVSLTARNRATGAQASAAPFRSRQTERTMVYPSHEVIGAAMKKVSADFSAALRAPRGLLDAIREVRR